MEEVVQLCHAFVEVLAMRQWFEQEDLLDDKWLSFQQSLAGLAAGQSMEESAYTIVNDLAVLLAADRVSLAQRQPSAKTRVLAISGVIKPEPCAARVLAIHRLCAQAIEQGKPLTEHVAFGSSTAAGPATTETGFQNYVCIPIASWPSSGEAVCDSGLLLEWQDYEAYLRGCSLLNYILPAFTIAWRQQQRWNSLPKTLRKLLTIRRSRTPSSWRASSVRWLAVAAGLVLAAWALNMPTRLRIEAQGTLQPIEQRVVFAALDGVVQRVLVDDGQAVQRGQTLLEMRSPMLEIQIEETLGEIETNATTRDGLNVLVNQLGSQPEVDVTRLSRLSSEIQELESKLITLKKKHMALTEQREKLVIQAPIAGEIVARQIHRYLDARPVQRGDALLRVVDLAGPWQLELEVADRDSGYVRDKLLASTQASAESAGNQADNSRIGAVPLASERELQFVYTAQPDIQRSAQATWLATAARNPLSQGMIVDLMAEVEPVDAAAGYMGAGVVAYVDCGQHPFWFVWTRPFIEAIQRRMWF